MTFWLHPRVLQYQAMFRVYSENLFKLDRCKCCFSVEKIMTGSKYITITQNTLPFDVFCKVVSNMAYYSEKLNWQKFAII